MFLYQTFGSNCTNLNIFCHPKLAAANDSPIEAPYHKARKKKAELPDCNRSKSAKTVSSSGHQPKRLTLVANGVKNEPSSLQRATQTAAHRHLSPAARLRSSSSSSSPSSPQLADSSTESIVHLSERHAQPATSIDYAPDGGEKLAVAAEGEFGSRKSASAAQATEQKQQQQQPVASAGSSAHDMAELSFRQSSGTASPASENHWIPIVSSMIPQSPPSSNNNHHHSQVPLERSFANGHGHGSASASLDYPTSLSAPSSTATLARSVATRGGGGSPTVLLPDRRQQPRIKPPPAPSQTAAVARSPSRPQQASAAQRPRLSPALAINGATRPAAASSEPLNQAASHGDFYSTPGSGQLYHNLPAAAVHWHQSPSLHYGYRRPRFNDPHHHLHHPAGAAMENEIFSIGASKMYKRVLLCDKTLVSLDYVRQLDAEPRPYGGAHAANLYHASNHELPSPSSEASMPESPVGLIDELLNDIGDNMIDLDGHYSILTHSYAEANSPADAGHGNKTLTAQLADQTSSRQPTGSMGRRNQTNHMHESSAQPGSGSYVLSASEGSSALSGSSSANDAAATESNSNGINNNGSASLSIASQSERLRLAESFASQPSIERRTAASYLLNDNDPLVRCDMWDLEKGLKSRKPPEHLLRIAIKADFDTVRDAINRCRQLSEKTLPPEDKYRDGLEVMSTEDLMSLFSMKRGLIPGTKWCGLGDQADSYNDLGPKHRIDICCRAHDHCPIRSKPFRNDYGVLNIGLYTKSHCDCDADFYRCLREVHSRTADMLGNLYFNVMKLQCMREERLKVCREMKPIALGFERCIRYEESPIKTTFKFTTPPVAY